MAKMIGDLQSLGKFMRFIQKFLAVSFLIAVGPVSADVIEIADRTALAQKGSIVVTSNFDDFAPTMSFLDGRFSRGDIVYRDTAVFGKNARYISPERNTIGTRNLPPAENSFSPGTRYSLLGFDIGAETATQVTFVLTTSLGKYTFPNVNLPAGKDLMTFKGFATTMPGEYFVSFLITTPDDYIGITDIALGMLPPAPAAK